MAGRKIKEGLNYFSLDIDFFDDLKILKIEEAFGVEGSYVVIRLLSWIYRNGYYINWNSEDSITYAKKIGNNISSSRLQDIVIKLLNIKFFDIEMYDNYSILTSRGIQSRWMDVNERSNRRATLDPKYDLLNIKSEEMKKKSKEIVIKSKEISNKSEEIAQKSEEMTRIKVNKIKERNKGKGHAISSDLKTSVEYEEMDYKIPDDLKKIPGLVDEFKKYLRLRNEQYRPIHPIQIESLLIELLDFKDPLRAVTRALQGNQSGKVYMHFFEDDKLKNANNQDSYIYSHLKPPSEAIDMRD